MVVLEHQDGSSSSNTSSLSSDEKEVFDLIIVDDIITDLDKVKNYLLIDKTNGLLKVMERKINGICC